MIIFLFITVYKSRVHTWNKLNVFIILKTLKQTNSSKHSLIFYQEIYITFVVMVATVVWFKSKKLVQLSTFTYKQSVKNENQKVSLHTKVKSKHKSLYLLFTSNNNVSRHDGL